MGGKTSFCMRDDLGAGVALIDRDHDDMVSLAQQLAKRHDAQDFEGIRTILLKLLAVAENHWGREEAMLKKFGYPGTEDHAQGHANTGVLLRQLSSGSMIGEAAFRAEDALVRQLIDDHKWKWWFLDAGVQPIAN